MLPLEHSAILSTFNKLQFVIKIFVLSILSGRFTQFFLYLQILLYYFTIPHTTVLILDGMFAETKQKYNSIERYIYIYNTAQQMQ